MVLQATWKWMVSPILYGAGAVSVFVVPVLLFVVLGGPIFGYVEVLGYLSGLLLVGSLILVLLDVGLARLEGLRSPGIRDHLRHCAVLYAGLMPLGVFVVFSYNGPSCCTQSSIAAILSLAVVYAAAVDASTIYILARLHRS